MYWQASDNFVYTENNAIPAGSKIAAKHIVREHNENIRQLAQREVTGNGPTASAAVHDLACTCLPNDLGDEINLRREADGWWYASTTIDTLGGDR